jgi:ABC-type multidrug transport system fused ATPase/permease subunit
MSQLITFIWKATPKSLKFSLMIKFVCSVITSLLDILALILFAQLFASFVQEDRSFLVRTVEFIGINGSIMEIEAVYVSTIIIIIILVLIKSIFILTVNRAILSTLSTQYERTAREISENFFKQQFNQIKAQPSYEVFLAVNSGIRDLFIIGTSASINVLTEIVVVTIIFSILIIQGGISSLVLATYFIVMFYLINKFCGTSSKTNSKILAESSLSAAVIIQAIVESIREIKVFNSLNWFLVRQQSEVQKSASALIDLQFVVFIPKIVLESTFVIGIALFTWFKIAVGEISSVVVEVGFLVAMGSRIIPSLLRLQFSLHQMKQVIGSSVYSMKLLDSSAYKQVLLQGRSSCEIEFSRATFNPEIRIENVSYSYSDDEGDAVSGLSLHIRINESVGIVGRTGSGKSTLVDLMLGVIEPKNGIVTMSGTNPLDVFVSRQGAVGFVPQNIALIDGSIRENLLLGRKPETFTEQDFRLALEFAGLSEYVAGRSLGLDSPLTRAGSELSGGQRQKLGIARAVLSRPQILILDEATSSLDSESESVVNEAIANLQGKLTLVVVAHRLTAIRSLDRILLLEDGLIAAEGSFSELLATNHTFQSFVNLSEL